MSRRRAFIVALIISIATLLLIYTLFHPHTSIEARSIKDIPEDFVKAINYLILSIDALDNASKGMNFIEVDRAELDSLAERLEEYSLGIDVGYGSLAEVFMRAATAYLSILNASRHIFDSLSTTYRAFKGVRESLRSLAMCRVDEALELYRDAKPSIDRSLNLLVEAFKHLATVDEESLLSDSHRRILENSSDYLAEAIGSLKSTEKLFLFVEKYRDVLERACRDSKALNGNQIEKILSELYSIKYRGSMYLAGEFYEAKQSLEDALQRALMKIATRSKSRAGMNQGSGAGYGVPPSDD